jgi:DNA-directed RNA polymerase subunit beta
MRAVGELLENQYRIGLDRMEQGDQGAHEPLRDRGADAPRPHQREAGVSAVVKEFFGSSQLSQFMDQTNPLSEVTHKRRLSALGPGGLTRERAGFDVRDVHPTHYGRICPIETPEGPNIGLIASLSTFARVNEFGFIETPYRSGDRRSRRQRGEVLRRLDEEPCRGQVIGHVIASGLGGLQPGRQLRGGPVAARVGGEFVLVPPDGDHADGRQPNQLVSVAASLVPFLENDDANRALMGSNMQRQAVPVIRTEAPLVGTGMERSWPVTRASPSPPRLGDRGPALDASRIVVKTEVDGTVRSAPTSTSTTSPSSCARTRTPASTSARWFARVTRRSRRGHRRRPGDGSW